jgi:phosphoribosylamine--glycine ligase
MKVLVIGSGAREHALTHKIKQSPKCTEIYAIPGNPGMELMGVPCLPHLKISDFESLKTFCREKDIDFVMVGPEIPLVQGMADAFTGEKTFVVGPNRKAAQLEASKAFTKEFLKKYHIPTARYQTFTKNELHHALTYIEQQPLPIVIKADGLAAGKGVIIAQSHTEAKEALLTMMQQDKFGISGHTVVIEEFMQGIELSVFVLCDGEHYAVLPEAKDYKRIGEQDTGLNTGGMGAVSPVPFADMEFMQKVEQTIIEPTIQGLIQENISYIGILFIGLMNVEGTPKVVEFNCRFGDPETQVVLERINNDWIDIFEHIKNKTLHQCKIDIKKEHVAGIVLASEGYPEHFETGKIIQNYQSNDEYTVYHAGTKWENNTLVNAGGRVFTVISQGNTLSEAKQKALKGARNIAYTNKYHREDIGFEFLD